MFKKCTTKSLTKYETMRIMKHGHIKKQLTKDDLLIIGSYTREMFWHGKMRYEGWTPCDEIRKYFHNFEYSMLMEQAALRKKFATWLLKNHPDIADKVKLT